MQTPGDQLWCWHRQSSKSTTLAALALEVACSKPHALVLVISPSLRQSLELYRRVRGFYDATVPLPLLRATQSSMELENHGRIICLPGTPDTIVGFSAVDLLVLDEASRILDSVYQSIRPMLARSGGRIIAASTPYGRRGFFFEAFEGESGGEEAQLDKATVASLLADLGWTVDEIPDVPERKYGWTKSRYAVGDTKVLSPYFLANERREAPALWFSQEYNCSFVQPMDAIFSHEDLRGMLDGSVLPLFPSGTHERDVLDGIMSTHVTPLF